MAEDSPVLDSGDCPLNRCPECCVHFVRILVFVGQFGSRAMLDRCDDGAASALPLSARTSNFNAAQIMMVSCSRTALTSWVPLGKIEESHSSFPSVSVMTCRFTPSRRTLPE